MIPNYLALSGAGKGDCGKSLGTSAGESYSNVGMEEKTNLGTTG